MIIFQEINSSILQTRINRYVKYKLYVCNLLYFTFLSWLIDIKNGYTYLLYADIK